MKTKSKSKRQKSMMSLAQQIGVSRSTLYTWKEAGAPIDKGEGAILEWAMAENKRGEGDEIKQARLAVLVETHRSLKLKNDERSDTTLKREDVWRESGQAMMMFWQAMDSAFGNELPPQLVGCTVIEIAEKLELQLEKLKEVCRVEFSRTGGGKLNPADFETVKLSVEAQAAMRCCNRRAWDEKLSAEWQVFMNWKSKADAGSKDARREWCQLRAAAGLPVPNATDEELAEHPGLKRTA